MFLRIRRFLASLRLAVVLIALYAGLIAGTSFLERSYGTPAVHFAVYETWWFLWLNVILAINVFFAALVRIPWRRRHTGFLITHLGLLLLMTGCLLSRQGGIEARLPIVEGRSEGRAYQESYHLVLEIRAKNASSGENSEKTIDRLKRDSPIFADHRCAAVPAKIGTVPEKARIPFIGGPFNWDTYQNKLSYFPWHFAWRNQGVLYERDGVRLEALDYHAREQEPSVCLRLSVDGISDEFWIVSSADELSASGDKRHTVESSKRQATVELRQDVIDLGFLVHLEKFQGKLDPGSGMPSHYSSIVDFLSREQPDKIFQKNVTITLNAPVDFTDPQSGYAWRLFQSSFNGPWKPGTRQFDAMAGKDRSRDQIYVSILTLSHDPGRALKYAGSLLIVIGISVVYCLRVQGSGFRLQDI
jgi:hypothetical protein